MRVGFTLQPDWDFLDRCDPVIREADYWEVAPETLWAFRGTTLVENAFHRTIQRMSERTGTPLVAHGVGASLGSTTDGERFSRWLDRIRKDHDTFSFLWYTDHLGVTSACGLNLALPLPLPFTREAAAAVRDRLAALHEIVGLVGVEHTAHTFLAGSPSEEPAFLKWVTQGSSWVLDVYNLWMMSENMGFDPYAWLDEAPLDRVVEIHVAGGRESDPAWLPSGRVLRLDSHDAPVPEAVWELLETVVPRCPCLQGVTLERMEGTVHTSDEVDALCASLERIRGLSSGGPLPPPPMDLRRIQADQRVWEEALVGWILHEQPHPFDVDGVELARRLVARLRFERLIQGSVDAARAYESDPAAFAQRFRAYHRAVLPSFQGPIDEATAFRDWGVHSRK